MPPIDPFQSSSPTATTQARRWAPVTPANTDLPILPKGLYVGGAGNLVLRGDDGADATFVVAAGTTLPVQPTQIRAATTATAIVALF